MVDDMPVSAKIELANPGHSVRECSDTNFCKYKPTSPHIPASQPSLFKFLSRTSACLPRPKQHLLHRTRLDVLETLGTRFIVKRPVPVREAKRREILQKLDEWVDEPSESINSEGVPIHVVQPSRRDRKTRKTRDLRSNMYSHALNSNYRLGSVFI